jgi:quercetin dioxygenase-like cupin family protein
MPYRVYDYRKDIRNLEITPEVRARFIRLEPREVHGRHSHDLGHEVFLVLEGHADIEIDGERAVLGPGQFCFVRAEQMHQVRNAGDTPLTMYLSVTPHIEPTHTTWSEGDEKLPPHYGGATALERAEAAAPAPPIAELASRQDAALQRVLRTVQAAVEAHGALLDQVRRGQEEAGGEHPASEAVVDALWAALFPLFRDVAALAEVWNDLAIAAGRR